VITNDMLHTVLRRRANGQSVEDIRPSLYILTGKHTGRDPSIHQALAEHDRRQAHLDIVEQAHANFTALTAGA
jgi:hypothetical protein